MTITTVDETLIIQAQVIGWWYLTLIITITIIIVWLFVKCKNLDEPLKMVAYIIVGMISLMFFLVVISAVGEMALTGIFNPEYFVRKYAIE